jgi:hypothetical protein
MSAYYQQRQQEQQQERLAGGGAVPPFLAARTAQIALVAVAGSTPTSKDQDRIGTPREVEVEVALETESRTGKNA